MKNNLPKTEAEMNEWFEKFWIPEEKRMKDNKFTELQIKMLRVFGQLAYTSGMLDVMQVVTVELDKVKKIIDEQI